MSRSTAQKRARYVRPAAEFQLGKIFVSLTVHANAEHVLKHLPTTNMPGTDSQVILSLIVAL
jgi:hypothetical protein